MGKCVSVGVGVSEGAGEGEGVFVMVADGVSVAVGRGVIDGVDVGVNVGKIVLEAVIETVGVNDSEIAVTGGSNESQAINKNRSVMIKIIEDLFIMSLNVLVLATQRAGVNCRRSLSGGCGRLPPPITASIPDARTITERRSHSIISY